MTQDNYELQRLSIEDDMNHESSNSEDYSSVDTDQDAQHSKG